MQPFSPEEVCVCVCVVVCGGGGVGWQWHRLFLPVSSAHVGAKTSPETATHRGGQVATSAAQGEVSSVSGKVVMIRRRQWGQMRSILQLG